MPKKKELKLTLENGRVLGENVLVKPIVIEVRGGFINPQQEEDRTEVGEVVQLGENCIARTSATIYFKVGDLVVFNKYSTNEIVLDDEKYYIVREEDLKFATSQ
jgi:co-chaperonin GroES (HSP10)